VKVGVWCGVGAKRKIVRVFFNETVNYENYLRVKRRAFSTPPVICEL
jgi:hypothetical protein